MEYKEYTPSENYRDIVHSYWVFKIFADENLAFPIKHETLPDSCLSIVAINQPYFNGVRILGPHSKKFQRDLFPNSIYIGIRFHPWIEIGATLTPKSKILNQTIAIPIELEGLFTPLINAKNTMDFSFNLLEERLGHFLKNNAVKENEMVKFICLELNTGNSIGTIIESIPSSIRVIQKKFKEVTGITMRQYANNSRLRKVWMDIIKSPNEKKEIIFQHNYYDQAHFINDFKKKMHRSYADFKKYMESVDISFFNN